MLTWIEIDRSALEHNLALYKKICAPALFAPVIKSNAYGHGMDLVAQICEEHPDVNWMCVASISEAVKLRTGGIKKPLLVLSIHDMSLEYVVTHTIDVVIYSLEQAQELSAHASHHKKYASIHIKIDTGLSRAGFLAATARAVIMEIHKLPWLRIQGIFTHFANSEEEDHSFVTQQLQRFTTLLTELNENNILIPLVHTTCSAATTTYKKTHFNFVRAGIGIYGLWPSQESRAKTLMLYPQLSLKPVMTWKTSIIQLKTIPAGSHVGYDLTFTTKQETLIALLPVGYWDGYPRALSNKGHVIIRNTTVPVIGRIAMNLMMIDVTTIPDITLNDEVILLGTNSTVSADTLADMCNTINYEFVTTINPLIVRTVVNGELDKTLLHNSSFNLTSTGNNLS